MSATIDALLLSAHASLEHLKLWEVNTWPVWFAVSYCAVIMLGLEVLAKAVPLIFGRANKIPVKGYHLDEFEFQDNLFIFINKCLTIMFVYHVIQVIHYSPSIVWDVSELTLLNSVGSLAAFYLFYDFFYMNFHKILHIRSLYSYVHKHHHRQKAPSRGNLDAINVHPFEFIVVAFFILAGGVLASLNHTRLDINVMDVFSVKIHDVHHRLPQSNYGQYTMFWDYLFGSFRSYDGPQGSMATGSSSGDFTEKSVGGGVAACVEDDVTAKNKQL